MVYIFTDGSAIKNGSIQAKGGVGVYFPDNKELNYSEHITYDTFKTKVTNNLTELYAIEKAINIIEYHNLLTNIIIYTDSEYCYKTFTIWAKNWEKNNWKKSDNKLIVNKELIKRIYELVIKYNIKFIHCNSHQKEPLNKNSDEYKIWYGNKMADYLATNTYQIK